ncbi:glycosyltransferase family 2 protein [Desulforhopalus singaporensis]|uniref:Glycosyltransferase, GT2 family n=1 Tax=Desulforhopalus singaporensis TaxID=91360 RepID=A0A1H0QN41_9BACT|nr:glycosyltransferase family 2 protein [Desulforhopalus singaporensis]SDP18169.1 Glycosyltransferase, GT2 family [Desulforhopalus singaporensis]
MTKKIYVIVVTHNSGELLPACLGYLNGAAVAVTDVIVVDCGSEDAAYVDVAADMRYRFPVRVIKTDNIGFGAGNNRGLAELDLGGLADDDLVLFMNPDTFISENWLSLVVDQCGGDASVGVISGKLLGFDFKERRGTGKIDSTGVFRAWYGRWYDRGQGEEDQGQYDGCEAVPAVCGALFCCRGACIKKTGEKFFDEDFFLYKEDIELSIRLRKNGWKLLYNPELIAFHCRGWQKRRKEVNFSLRLMSAKNEILLYRKHLSPYILWAGVKYGLVRFFRL